MNDLEELYRLMWHNFVFDEQGRKNYSAAGEHTCTTSLSIWAGSEQGGSWLFICKQTDLYDDNP